MGLAIHLSIHLSVHPSVHSLWLFIFVNIVVLFSTTWPALALVQYFSACILLCKVSDKSIHFHFMSSQFWGHFRHFASASKYSTYWRDEDFSSVEIP